MTHESLGSAGQIVLAAVKTLILLAGGSVTYFAHRAYKRTGDRSLGLLATGFGLITFGVLLAGLVYEVLGTLLSRDVPLGYGIIAESLLVLVGMVVIAYSLYER